MIIIEPIKAFTDNYLWGLYNPQTKQAAVVDPGDAAPVQHWLEKNELTLTTLLITHHHSDHIGGIDTLLTNNNLIVYGPNSKNIPQVNSKLQQQDKITVLGTDFRVIEIPGHTLDHIAYYSESGKGILFCGDTLFAGGCGRVFEGNPEMMLGSLTKLSSLPDSTRVYCAHEYTLANLKFASAVEPTNTQLAQRVIDDTQLRHQNLPTVPSTIKLEKLTNPFLRCLEPAIIASASEHRGQHCSKPSEVFSAIRGWKDNF
jgi:hydroxyacylglutathione hydrolase